MTNYKRTWIKVFITLFPFLPGLPYVLLALAYLLNRIGLQGLWIITPWKIVLRTYFAIPSLLLGKGLNPESLLGHAAGLGVIIVAAILYSLLAFGLAFPISKWLVKSRGKKLKEGQINPLDSAASTESLTAHKKNMSVKKRILKTGAIIALILATLFATKALLIQYHLFRYRQITAAGLKDFSVDKMISSGNPIETLYKLGYLSTYSIPIQQPRSDAEAQLELIHMVMINQGIPASASIENRSGSFTLEVGDRLTQKKGWEMLVRLYLETPKGQPSVPDYQRQSAPQPGP